MSLGFCATCGSIVLNLPQISATEDLSSSFLDRAAGVKTSSNTAQPLACNAFEISEGSAFSTPPSSSGIPSLPFIPDFVMPTCGGRIKSLWTTTLPLFKSGCSNWPWARGETNASENRMDPKHETLAFIDPPPNYAPRPGVTSTHFTPTARSRCGSRCVRRALLLGGLQATADLRLVRSIRSQFEILLELHGALCRQLFLLKKEPQATMCGGQRRINLDRLAVGILGLFPVRIPCGFARRRSHQGGFVFLRCQLPE